MAYARVPGLSGLLRTSCVFTLQVLSLESSLRPRKSLTDGHPWYPAKGGQVLKISRRSMGFFCLFVWLAGCKLMLRR